MFISYNKAEIVDMIGRIVGQTGATYEAAQIAEALQLTEEDIRRAGPWPHLLRTIPWTITTVAVYDTGTVNPTLDSTAITGSGTAFTSAMIGRKIRIEEDSRFYRIAAVPSATSITLDEAYENDDLDGSNRQFKIYVDEYNLPPELDIIYQIRNEKSTTPLTRQHVADFFMETPTASAKGDPFYYDILDRGTQNQPAGASTLVFTSSAGATDSGKVVLVRGIVSSVQDYEELTLNASGTITSTKNYARTDDIIKSAAYSGKLTVTSNSGNITIHTIPPEYLKATTRKLWLYPYPEKVMRIYVSGYELPQRLLRDYDAPTLPPDLYVYGGFSNVLLMSGEHSKAIALMKIFFEKMGLERKHMTDKDDVLRIYPDTVSYPLG